MNELYEKELSELKAKMEKSELFANKFPCFSKQILAKKLSDQDSVDFGSWYKQWYFPHGIYRHHYGVEGARVINYPNATPNKFLFSLYFNSCTFFDSYEEYGLEILAEDESVFFYDASNSTFYIEDEHIEEFMDKAYVWYLEAVKKNKRDKIKDELKLLEKQLSEIDV